MSREIASFTIEKICSVLDLQRETIFPCKTHFQALKTKLENAREQIGPDTDEQHIDKLRDKLYDLDDLLLECLALSGKQSMMSMVNNCTPFKSINLNNKFRILKDEIEKILSRIKHEPEPQREETKIQEMSEDEEEFYEYTTSYVDESRIYGWDDEANKIAEEIFNNTDFTATAIVGICGSGKTTLAQKVFVHDKMKDKFAVRLWVCIGPECTKEELLYRMLDNLGLDVEEVMRTIEDVEVVKTKGNEEERSKSKIGVLLYILHLQLRNKGYLIVFDDVREDMHPEWYRNLTTQPPIDKEWDERFAYGLPKINDSAVIVTCRKEEFGRMMVDAGGIYSPERLEEKEAWLVFKRSFEEAMNKALKKDMKKLKYKESEHNKDLENKLKEIEERLKNEMKDFKREIEDKSMELKEINDGILLINAKKQIEAALNETKGEIRLNQEKLVEAEKLLEDARSEYEKEKSLEEIDKEISANNEHLDKVKEEARKDNEKEKSLEGVDKEISANNEHLDKVKEEARKDNEKEKSLEGVDKEISANNEHLGKANDGSEDVQKVIPDEIAKLKEKKEEIIAKKKEFERCKNNVEEIKKKISDKKKEEENMEKELAAKIQAVTEKNLDERLEEDFKKKGSVLEKEIKEKQEIVDKATKDAGLEKERLKKEVMEIINKTFEVMEKRKSDLQNTTNRIIKELKLEKMKKQIRDKCLGLPVALTEAAKGLAFEEYNKLYHPDS